MFLLRLHSPRSLYDWSFTAFQQAEMLQNQLQSRPDFMMGDCFTLPRITRSNRRQQDHLLSEWWKEFRRATTRTWNYSAPTVNERLSVPLRKDITRHLSCPSFSVRSSHVEKRQSCGFIDLEQIVMVTYSSVRWCAQSELQMTCRFKPHQVSAQ